MIYSSDGEWRSENLAHALPSMFALSSFCGDALEEEQLADRFVSITEMLSQYERRKERSREYRRASRREVLWSSFSIWRTHHQCRDITLKVKGKSFLKNKMIMAFILNWDGLIKLYGKREDTIVQRVERPAWGERNGTSRSNFWKECEQGGCHPKRDANE